MVEGNINFSTLDYNGYAKFWYYNIGLNVFPADSKNKKPIVKWKEYETESISEEQFEQWITQDKFKNGMCIICGKSFRGKYVGSYLNVIDCDNKLAIDRLFHEGLESIATRTIVEQHDNPAKAHVYLLSDKPMKIVAPAFPKNLREDNTVPSIEVKANGRQIIYCANSPHKDGSRIRIIGTDKIRKINADTFDDIISKINAEYSDYKSTDSTSKGFDAYTIPYGEMVKGSFYVRGHGFNRQMVLLRYLVHIKADNPGITEPQLLDFGRKFNKKHFEIKLDDDEVKVKTENALNFGAKVALDRLEEEIKKKETVDEKKEEDQEEKEDDVEYIVTDPKYRKTTIKLPFIKRTIKDKVTTYDIDRLARSIIKKLHIKTVYELDEIYYYSVDNFFDKGKMLVLNICEECIETCAQRDSSEVVNKIKRISSIKIGEINKKHEGYLYTMNGILDIHTRELKDYTPDDFILNRMPVIYDTKATCPKIIKFLTECLPNKKDRHTTLESLAACHIPELRLEKAFMNLGGGGNGKSIWLHLMECYLGEDSCCSISIHDIINSRFKIARLFGKIANMYAEISKREIKELDKFKLVVSGDRITAEKKGKDPFDFYPKARHFFSVNRLPQIEDDTDAVFRRFMIVMWRQQFTKVDDEVSDIIKKADIELYHTLKTPQELSGLLNIMLGLVTQLKKIKRYTHEKSVEEVRKTWLTESNSVVKFSIFIEISEGWMIPKAELYGYYCKWCKLNKETPETMDDFYVILKKEIPDIGFTRRRDSGDRVRYVQNIRIKSEKAHDIGFRDKNYKEAKNTTFDDIF